MFCFYLIRGDRSSKDFLPAGRICQLWSAHVFLVSRWLCGDQIVLVWSWTGARVSILVKQSIREKRKKKTLICRFLHSRGLPCVALEGVNGTCSAVPHKNVDSTALGYVVNGRKRRFSADRSAALLLRNVTLPTNVGRNVTLKIISPFLRRLTFSSNHSCSALSQSMKNWTIQYPVPYLFNGWYSIAFGSFVE